MSKSIVLLVALLLAPATAALAQSTTVRGVLADSITHQGEPYATVRVFKEGEMEKPVAMSLTDANGVFSQTVTGKGNYVVSFSSVGRKEIIRKLSLNGESALNLDSLWVQDDAQTLGNVEIVARKPLVKMETDKMSYDVQADAEVQSMTVLDMLRKVPMVTVDGQDNITVNGSGSFKVLVDNKPSPMFNTNTAQIFKAMPASMVKKIEVLTNPGAKYDAEGVGGVLNLVLNKETSGSDMDGYNGNISASAGNMHNYMGSVYVNGQQGKWSYSASVMAANRQNNDMTTETERLQQTAAGEQRILSLGDADNHHHFVNANVGLGYEIDSMSSVNMNIGFNDFVQKTYSTGNTTFSGGAWDPAFGYSERGYNRDNYTSINGEMDYQRFFNKERTHSLTLSYQIATSPTKNESTNYYTADSTAMLFLPTDRHSNSRPRSTEHTFHLDYTLPLGSMHTLNFGNKYIRRINKSDSKYYDLQDGEAVLNEDNSVNYKNTQDILAAYAEYVGNYGNFSTKEGLRYEHTWEKVDFIQGAGENFKRNYGVLVPSASMSYNLSQQTNLGVNYTMRIVRPGIWALNPYVDRSATTSITYGNPSLKTEKSHYVSLVFNTFTPKFSFNLTIGQNFCNNQIGQYSFMDGNIMNTTYGNIIKNRWTNITSFINWMPTLTTRLMLSGGVDYGDIRSDELGEHNHGWQANVYAGLEQTLPLKVKLSLGTWNTTRNLSLQGNDGSAMGFGFVSVNRDFCKERLNISLRGTTAWGGDLRIKTAQTGADFSNRTRISIPMQEIDLIVTWKFGNQKKYFRQHQSRKQNDFDDKQKSGTSGSPMGQMGI